VFDDVLRRAARGNKAAMAERPAWMRGIEVRRGADGKILNAEEIVTAWWRHVVEQDGDPRDRKELEDRVMKMYREQFDNPEGS
jgi:hypothetical protein